MGHSKKIKRRLRLLATIAPNLAEQIAGDSSTERVSREWPVGYAGKNTTELPPRAHRTCRSAQRYDLLTGRNSSALIEGER